MSPTITNSLNGYVSAFADAHIFSLLYNILFNPLTPRYLNTWFNFLFDTHYKPLRSSDNLKLEMPGYTTKFLDHSLSRSKQFAWLIVCRAKT